ncbi:hypothetical protein Q3G72_007779 [Acer saccharum]|nr:hypothetical protein Q3G72_007779 [Acer saccharum]
MMVVGERASLHAQISTAVIESGQLSALRKRAILARTWALRNGQPRTLVSRMFMASPITPGNRIDTSKLANDNQSPAAFTSSLEY